MKPSELFTEITNRYVLYNIQSISNIPSIMKFGLMSNEKASFIKHISVAMQEIQDRRDAVIIPNGMPLHMYANLYFDPRNPMLFKIKDKNETICILHFDRSVLDINGAVVSDRNAASGYASFYPPETGLKEIDFDSVFASNWTDSDIYAYFRKKSIKCAEVLVPNKVPYSLVVGASVFDEKAKTKLKDLGFDKAISVDSSLFF